MTTTQSSSLATRAAAMADVVDLAGEVTRILGGARAARLDPDAMTSLAGAAMALGASSLEVYQATRPAYGADAELLEEVAEVEDATAVALPEARQLADEARRELAAARAAKVKAQAALAAARMMPAATARQREIRAAAIERAQRQVDEALTRIEVAEEALEILRELTMQLRRALALLGRVPEDLGETYEAIYDHIRAGGVMPKDGDWMTGAPGRPVAAAAPQVRPAGPCITASVAFSDPCLPAREESL